MTEAGARARCGLLLAALLVPFVFASGLGAQQASSSAGTGDGAGPATGLSLVNLDLLDSRDGYAIPADSRFLPGETIHVYCQIAGYSVGEEDRVVLRYEMHALDPDGRRFYSSEGGKVDVELAPQDKDWKPVVRYSPEIPAHAGGGSYSIRIAVIDELAGERVETLVPVAVDGARVRAADELLVRNFEFSRTEGGSQLDEPVFDPGDEVWASFFITGYETRDDNTFDVESDAWVLDARGERMFSFESRGQAGHPDYPRLWLPATIRLDLEDSVPPGPYTVVLRLRDRLGETDATQHYEFRIR